MFKLPKRDGSAVKNDLTSSGQALLLVLVGMGAVMVLVLSVVSRSITDISLTNKEDESARAFSAAEAGVEKQLVSLETSSSGNLGNNSQFTAVTTKLSEGLNYYNVTDEIKSGEYATLWFVSHDNTGKMSCSGGLPCYSGPSTLQVCFGKSSPATVELSVYYDPTTKSYDPVNTDYSGILVKRTAAFITGPTCTINGKNYLGGGTINLTGLTGLLFARARIFYNSVTQPVGFSVSSGSLPAQGTIITSTGTSGDATRKVQVIEPYEDTLPILDTTLFSGNNLSK